MSATLKYSDLPGFFLDADAASLRGQRLTVRYNAIRLAGLLAGAIGGALTWKLGFVDAWGLLALVGFAAALVSEVVLLSVQPERDWYSGRALAESAKTLAWRYAVRADPFFDGLGDVELRAEMRRRLAEIAEKGRDRITLSADNMELTRKLVEIRSSSFSERRKVYVESRIKDQRDWYARKADHCKRLAFRLRSLMILIEVVAVVAAASRALGVWSVDISGILAALVASGAAWFGLRQYSSLASAYSVAAAELNINIGRLEDAAEPEWAVAVADAEEAISREHTMWLASRTGAL